jgi:hypothetical protein
VFASRIAGVYIAQIDATAISASVLISDVRAVDERPPRLTADPHVGPADALDDAKVGACGIEFGAGPTRTSVAMSITMPSASPRAPAEVSAWPAKPYRPAQII